MVTIQQQLTDDLDAVFDYGLQINITHVNGAVNETIKGFWDPEYSRLLEEGGVAVESDKPSILIRTSEAGNIDRDSTFTIDSVTWYPLEVESDQHGTQRIYLSKTQVS